MSTWQTIDWKIRLSVAVLLLCAMPARAHDLWLEKDSSGYLLHQGHRHSAHAGAEYVRYNPAFAKSVVCIDVGGAAKPQA